MVFHGRSIALVLVLLTGLIPTVGALVVDWRLITRSLTYPEAPIMAADWYQPKVPVPGPAEAVSLATAQPTPPLAEALQEVSAYARMRNSTGLVVMHRGRVIWEEYWQGHDATSTFNAMSMSKTIAGLLVGIAINEGAIAALDTPVSQYFPEWREDPRASITVEDLIYMQSGLRNERQTDTLTSDLVQMYAGSNVARVALRVPSVRPPGQRFEYNNVNTQVLSLLIEQATGQPYADYLATRLWQPLGAADASIWLDRPNGSAKTFCCLFATARDWARVGQMLMADGRVGQTQVVPSGWLRQMLAPSPLEPTFGAHIWIKARTPDYPNVDQSATAPFLADDTFYLDGRGLQRVYVIPSQELVIVRMGEQPPNWDDAVIPNRLVEALVTP